MYTPEYLPCCGLQGMFHCCECLTQFKCLSYHEFLKLHIWKASAQNEINLVFDKHSLLCFILSSVNGNVYMTLKYLKTSTSMRMVASTEICIYHVLSQNPSYEFWSINVYCEYLAQSSRRWWDVMFAGWLKGRRTGMDYTALNCESNERLS